MTCNRFCPAGPSAFQRSRGCRPTLRTVSHPPGTVRADTAAVHQARPDEAEARRGVLCRVETLAVDQCRKWLTKWRPESADLSITRDSHSGINGIEGIVPHSQQVAVAWHCWFQNSNKLDYASTKTASWKVCAFIPHYVSSCWKWAPSTCHSQACSGRAVHTVNID